MIRAFGILVGSLTLAFIVGPAPGASADLGQFVRTESGKVRCTVSPSYSPDSVGCEYGPGFPQAPIDPESGNHKHLAIVNASGALQWVEGNIDGLSPYDIVLTYGQTYHIRGWTILPSSDGTRFTNDGTGHGMFVSIENVYSF